jgi:hypothetical protein
MSWPQATRADHDRFCRVEGWHPVRDARGRSGTHHVTYELGLPDGRILRTRISQPVDRSGYGRSMWQHLLRDQLQVNESEFWACVQQRIVPDRGAPAPPPEALPAELVHLLIHHVGLPEAEIAAMTKHEAVTRLERFWAE